MLTPDDLISPLIESLALSDPDALDKMITPIKPITKAKIRKYIKHVNKLIEGPRAKYFRDEGIKPVPHPFSEIEIKGQLEKTTRLWITLFDKYGKEAADNQIKHTSRFLAYEDAKAQSDTVK